MRNIRSQSIEPGRPFEFHLAADSRGSRTDYTDDQVWTVRLGGREEAALAFQTQFGGRAGLVSLVPMWRIADRLIYQQPAYSRSPVITHFAPDFLQVEAALQPELELLARFWAMESHAAGGEFCLSHQGDEPIRLQLQLFGHVAINRRQRKLNVLTLVDQTLALHLGQIGGINPVVTLEGAGFEVYGGRINSPMIGCQLELAPGETIRIPFVVAGLADMRDSFSVAMNWMSRPWDSYFEGIDRRAAALPKISSGNADWDRLIDLSYAQLIKSFLQPTEHLPHPSIVANRVSNRGWSRRGDGADHIRAWSGQDPILSYLVASAIASADSELAKGIIRNYLSLQDESGYIDRQPGLAGQRQGLLMMPILARMSWNVYQVTDDQAFVAEVLPALLAFFGRWQAADLDADGDGSPEWRSERQMGYIAFPTFGRGQAWAQGAAIHQMETPDLLAYLISEADALRQMAELLGEAETVKMLAGKLELLEAQLEDLWDGDRYRYRDRDSHLTGEGIELLRAGTGDQVHVILEELPAPARVMIRVVGGVSQRPNITLTLEGKDETGAACQIEATVDDFLWQNRQGIFTTEQVLSHIERIFVKGLSRVYKVYAHTIDSSRLDINALLPLFCGRLSSDRAAALVELALDEAHFWRPSGLSMVSAKDRNFDPSNARGGGGIWMYWLSLVGDGMVQAGYRKEATDLVKRVLTCLSRVLEREGYLSQFYHADEAVGFGEDHHIGGVVPLKLLSDVIGVTIPGADRVWVGGDFSWGEPITIEQHGVTVRRSADEISIVFPSGHKDTLLADAPWQLLLDPAPAPAAEEPAAEPEIVEIPLPSELEPEGPLVIDVEEGQVQDEPSAGLTDTTKDDDDEEDDDEPASE